MYSLIAARRDAALQQVVNKGEVDDAKAAFANQPGDRMVVAQACALGQRVHRVRTTCDELAAKSPSGAG